MKKIKGKAILIGGTIIAGLAGLFGIIKLISEGEEIVSLYGVPYYEMGEIEKQQFNEKFDIYEGTKTGAQVKQLIKAVSASNTSNPVQQVTLDGDTSLFSTSVGEDGIATYKESSNIGNSKKYIITMSEYTSGIVSKITIKEREVANKNNEVVNSVN